MRWTEDGTPISSSVRTRGKCRIAKDWGGPPEELPLARAPPAPRTTGLTKKTLVCIKGPHHQFPTSPPPLLGTYGPGKTEASNIPISLNLCQPAWVVFAQDWGPPLLTCWDSLAAAAASPVSMEATLVPSRTGLSCLGTDGPTLALGKKVSLPQLAARHCGHP